MSLRRSGVLPLMRLAANVAFVLGCFIGFLSPLSLLAAVVVLSFTKLGPFLAVLVMVPFAKGAWLNGKLFRVMTVQNQAAGVTLTAVYATIIGVVYSVTGSIWGIPVAFATVLVGPFLVWRILGAASLRDKLDEMMRVHTSHTTLHEEMEVLRRKIEAQNLGLEPADIKAVFQLYSRGCMHIHEQAVVVLRESRVGVAELKALRDDVARIHPNDPFHDDLWRIVREKEYQIRRQLDDPEVVVRARSSAPPN